MSGFPITPSKPMLQVSGAVPPIGMASGFSGHVHQNGPISTSWLRNYVAPIVLSCAVWGRYLSGRRILFECDNFSVVSAVNKHYTREQNAMHLLRCLWFFVAHFDIDIKCRHIPGVNNCTADHLSRNNLSAFFSLHPQAHHQATILPQPLLQMLEVGGPDWTSPQFRQLFSIIIRTV